MPPRAVLFDFDGVIADTENVHIAAWERTFAAMGWDVPPEVCARAAEEDDRVFLAKVFAGRGILDGDITGWIRRKQTHTVAMLSSCSRLYPGVRELIANLSGQARLAVVSTTWRENILSVLRASGLEPAFELIISKEDVQTPKPDPEAYRLAVKRLKIPANQAVALEDSATGMTSARKAGVKVVAVGHRKEPGEWSEGGEFVEDLVNLPDVLRAMGD